MTVKRMVIKLFAQPSIALVLRWAAESFKRPFDAKDYSVFFSVCAMTQIFTFVTLYLLFADEGISEKEESLIYFLYFSLAPVLALIGYRLTVRVFATINGAGRLINVFVVLVPVGIVLFCVSHAGSLIYFTYESPKPSIPLSGLRFISGFLLYAGIAIAMLHGVLRRQGLQVGPLEAVPIAAKFIGFGLIVSLFDIYMMIDTLSLSPYAAPALLVANGHVPLVETFSQYGLNFLIFSFAFLFLPQSLFTMAVVVGVLNILMYMVFVGIAVNLARNKIVIFVIAVCTVFFVHSAHLYNINYTPSVFAMRFLPPLALIFSLTFIRPGRFFCAFSTVCLGVCALWSIEALIFGALTYSTYGLLCCVGHRYSVASFARFIIGIVGIVGLPHAAISFMYKVILGVLPDYGTYLQLVFFHFSGGPYWKLLIEPDLRIWILFGFVYVSALTLTVHIAMQRMRDKDNFSHSVAAIGAVAVLGILMFYYYIGRSATPILTFVSLPLFLLIIASVDWSISELREWNSITNRRGQVLAPVVFISVAIGFPLMGGVFADKFFRPFSQHLSNSSILRNWTQTPLGSTVQVDERIRTMKLTTAASDSYPQNEAGGSLSYTHTENRAAFEVIKALAEDKSQIFVFIADPVPVLFHMPEHRLARIAYPPHKMGIAYPTVDGLSAKLTERGMNALNVAKIDDIAIVGELPRSPFDDRFFEKLQEKWTLCRVPNASKVMIYRLRPKSESACP